MNRIPAQAALFLSLAGLLGVAGRVPPCAPDGADFCALQRAEDLVFVPGTNWFAVSNATPQSPLVFIDAASRRRVALVPPFTTAAVAGAPDCPGPPAQFRAGGNDLRRVDGKLRLAVLNNAPAGTPSMPPTPDRIELFALTTRDGVPQARWAGCIAVPAAYSLNDVALAADGSVYGSHQFDRPASPEAAAATRQKWLDGQPTGYAVQWTRAGGWVRVPGTDVSFANGIAVSRDDRLLALAGTYSAAVLLVDRRRGTVQRVALPHTPDNVTALADGSFLSVGHTGVPVTGVDPCRPADAVPCGFPFSVAHILPGRGAATPRLRVLFEHDGSRIPGASVAVPHGDRLYLGSYFGERVTVVEASPGTPRE